MKRVIKILIIIIAIFSFICINKVNAATNGTVTENVVNVREKDATDSKIVMYVYKNDKVEIIEKTGDWYKIKYKDKEGYVFSEYIKTEETETNGAENNDESETVNNTEVKLNISAGTNVKIIPNVISTDIFTTTKDTTGEIIEQLNGWTYINIEGINGWIRNEKITANEENQNENENVEDNNNEENSNEEKSESKSLNKKAYVKHSSVNLRKEPSTDATVVEKLKLNTEVTIIEEVDSIWYKVKVGDKEGYISQDLLSSEKQKEDSTSRDGDTSSRETDNNKNTTTTENKKEETKTSTSSNSKTKGEEIVAYAKQYLGYSYVYGGSSPKTGFDCSGFTSYVYKHFGYTISRSASGQASDGVKVEKKDLQPGDLVIYKNNALTKIGHVGIYIGDNKMIHASEPGVGVIITDIDAKSHNYPKRYVMGRRII